MSAQGVTMSDADPWLPDDPASLLVSDCARRETIRSGETAPAGHAVTDPVSSAK